jgi:hypothetical protein
MKTPREILFNRHRNAEPRLDAIRHAVVEGLNDRAAAPQSAGVVSLLPGFPRAFWREVIQPARRVWGGLAAAWVVVLLLNVVSHAGAPRMTAANSSNAANYIMTLREQEQLMAGLSGRWEPNFTEPPKPYLPRPRSERHGEFFMI